MARRMKLCVLLIAMLGLLSATAQAEDELIFRIALEEPPHLLQPVRFKAWVLNQSDHQIRIPRDLKAFVLPGAYDVLAESTPTYTCSVAVPNREVESVTLSPGGFYGCALEHGAPIATYSEMWFTLFVGASDANPHLWSGTVESNRVFVNLGVTDVLGPNPK